MSSKNVATNTRTGSRNGSFKSTQPSERLQNQKKNTHKKHAPKRRQEGPKDMKIFTVIVHPRNGKAMVYKVWVHDEQTLKSQWPASDQSRYFTLFDDRTDSEGKPRSFSNVDGDKLPRHKITLRWCRNRKEYIPIKQWFGERDQEREDRKKDNGVDQYDAKHSSLRQEREVVEEVAYNCGEKEVPENCEENYPVLVVSGN